MKKIRLLLAILTITSISITAQESKKFSVSSITVSTGKTALTSGLDTKITFSDGSNKILFVQANNDRIIVNIGKKIKNFSLVESIGVFKNVPWTGPMLLYQKGCLDVTIWNGISMATNPELTNPGYKPQFFFSYEAVGFTFLGNNRIGADIQWFKTDKMNWFLSYKKTLNLGDNSRIFGAVTYNRLLDIPMFVIGYTIKIN